MGFPKVMKRRRHPSERVDTINAAQAPLAASTTREHSPARPYSIPKLRAAQRLGVAMGLFSVPDNIDRDDDEIAESFSGMHAD
ncbi:hypothetical protein [Bordetella bronchialis]|uniref:hypothetical protein n=1 Tax=Bordetella bronchialis TaxID=463025 RepID=UPI000ACBE90D|nr:hypothetical protein [Bordetella bronchialis]